MKTNFLEYLEETALRLPGKTAFYDDKDRLTFVELAEMPHTGTMKVDRVRLKSLME